MIIDATVRRACAVGLLAFVLASCGDDTNAGERTTGDVGNRTVEGDAGTEMAPATFVQKAASSGMYEVQAADLALQKEITEPVRNLAPQMKSDHQKANDELKSIAAETNITVPTALDEKHQEMLTELQGMNGPEFEQKYLEQQRKAHVEAIDLFERAQTQLPQGRLATFAQQTLPRLRQHLDMVQKRNTGGDHTGTGR